MRRPVELDWALKISTENDKINELAAKQAGVVDAEETALKIPNNLGAADPFHVEWRASCIQESIAPEGHLERENKMAKKSLKKSKKLESTKPLMKKA